ncbi:hypothetical protein NDU88_001497 [Pleurodeles waltl]|uniref:Uncharacterized protein n=1 Tax=Pleurodeles waltl TaxID=8319 RepID=A0AAV7MKN7_PLEWA|nr:hypothetical protein NDU88_001497 [Pleurodeles waltl]
MLSARPEERVGVIKNINYPAQKEEAAEEHWRRGRRLMKKDKASAVPAETRRNSPGTENKTRGVAERIPRGT